jgi:hypothetical protein
MPKGQKIRIITPQQDEIIRKCWDHNSYGHHAAKRAAQMTGLSPSVTHRRAMELGLVFTRERYRWTEPELKCVEENPHLALETIQKRLARGVSPPGIKRTRAAIAGQIHDQRFRTNMDGLRHGPLADALGISAYTLERFRSSGLIHGERLESLRQACGYVEDIRDENRHWFYHNDQIVLLLFAARGELDLRKVNATWLMGVLEQYITLFQITPKNALNAKRERTKLAQRRRNKQAGSRKPRSTGSRPARTGILGESAVDAIRAGKTVLTRHGRGRRSTGDPVSRPAAPAADTGTISLPNGGASGNSKRESGAATSHSDSPFSGPVGDLSADSHIAHRTDLDT